MKAKYNIESPGDVNATMTITMTVAQWEKLNEQLSENYPSWQLSSLINCLVNDARKVIYPPEGNAHV